MKYKNKVLMGLCAVALAFTAQAGDNGFYLGGSLGYASFNEDESELAQDLTGAGLTGTVSLDEEDFGWKLFGGYNFTQYFGAEFAYVDLGSVDVDFSITAPLAGSGTAEVDVDGFTFMGVGRYPIQPNFEVFAKVGAFVWDAEGDVTVTVGGISATVGDDDDGTDVVFGLGASYHFTNNVGVRAEWERYNTDNSVDFFSLGLEYRF